MFLASDIKILTELGLNSEQISGVISLLETVTHRNADRNENVTKRNGNVTQTVTPDPLRSVTVSVTLRNAALRQKRYRDRKKIQQNQQNSVTQTVTHRNVTRNADTSSTYLLKKESKTTGKRYAVTLLPSEWKEFCLQKRPDLNPEEIFAEFSDYWIAVPGSKGVKLDWYATWRNWVRGRKSQNQQQKFNYQKPTETKKGMITL